MEDAIPPHGGTLVDRELTGEGWREAEEEAAHLPHVSLNPRCLSDLELLSVGAYSPLRGFMGKADYEGVVSEMRLRNGVLWPLPITLAVDHRSAEGLREGQRVALHSPREEVMGILELEEIYDYDREKEARLVYRTADEAHPGVRYLYRRGEVLLGGPVWLQRRPRLAGFECYKRDPAQSRAIFRERGWRSVVAFQTRNPIHRAHEYVQKCALELLDGLLIHPLVGTTKLDDVPSAIRMRCYEVLIERYYPMERVLLSVFPGAMRYAGPREAVFHAIVRQNYGCTHFIVGRDHAGVGNFYDPFAAHRIFGEFEPGALAISPIFFDTTFYCRKCGAMASSKTCPHDPSERLTLSGSRVRELLRSGEALPEEFTRPEVAQVLAKWAVAQ